VESSSDSSLSSPLPTLRPNMVRVLPRSQYPRIIGVVQRTRLIYYAAQVGLLPLALSFLHLAETREMLAYMAPHTLALPLLDGEVFGPYTSLDPEYRSSASCDRTLVPQLLTIHGRDWHYRPDSPESVEEEEDPTRKSTTISSLSLSWDKCLGVGRPLELRLTSTLAYGHLWDAFRAVLISMTVENEVVESPMIVKMTCPVMFPSGSTRGKYREGYTELEARVAIANEDAIYRTVASKVNRNVVPSYHGLWGGSLRLDARWPGQREVWVMLLEDCGSAVSADDLSESDRYVCSSQLHKLPESLSPVGQLILWLRSSVIRNLVVSHYVDLHSAGVVHNDVEARHWLRHPDGGIRIIDFEAAKRVDGKASELAESEIEEVMYRLGLNSRRNGLPGGR